MMLAMVMSDRDGTQIVGWAVSVPRDLPEYPWPVAFMYAARVSSPEEAETLVRAFVKAKDDHEVRVVGALKPETLDRLGIALGVAGGPI